MNPNRGEAPQASSETPLQPQSPEAVDNALEQGAEAPVAAPEKSGNQPQTPVLPLIPDDIPAAGQPALPAAASDNQSAQTTAHTDIPDSDHIPEVWIDKTKSVIAQTRQDPYVQKNEIVKIKAEYNQKRFNKQIKVDTSGE
jgi:hypothetical protein